MQKSRPGSAPSETQTDAPRLSMTSGGTQPSVSLPRSPCLLCSHTSSGQVQAVQETLQGCGPTLNTSKNNASQAHSVPPSLSTAPSPVLGSFSVFQSILSPEEAEWEGQGEGRIPVQPLCKPKALSETRSLPRPLPTYSARTFLILRVFIQLFAKSATSTNVCSVACA